MFDTHCHLYEKVFNGSLDKIFSESRESGVSYFLVPGISVETSKSAIEIANTYQNTYAAVGIHPTEKLNIEELPNLEMIIDELSKDRKVVAIGEAGLDYYRFESSPEIQKSFLKTHLKLAMKREKAIILHNRQATTDLLKIIKDDWQDTLRGKIIFHCSSLENEIIEFSENFDCYLGVDGDISYDEFKRSQIKKINLNAVLLETDSPLLLPEPFRSNKLYPNKPSNLNIVAENVANLLNINKEEIIERSTLNAKRVFAI
jgi:TatD DNase family protein